jgi:hypothetical protein
VATLIGVVAALIGVPVAVLQLRAAGKQRRREFEYLFVQRYWKIMDDLSLEAIECTKPDGGVVSSSDRTAVITFLTLSQDELDLRARRWISTDTWELWRVGMTTHLRRWPFDVVWKEVRDRESGAVDGQFSPLRKAAGSRLNEVGFDPATEGKRRPWQGH